MCSKCVYIYICVYSIKLRENTSFLGGFPPETSVSKPQGTCLQWLDGGLFAEPPSSAGDAFLHRSKGLFVRVVDRLRRDGPTRPRAHHVQVSSTFMLIRFAHLTTNIVMLCRFLQTSIAFQYAPTVHNNVKNILMFFLRSLYINSPTFNLSLHWLSLARVPPAVLPILVHSIEKCQDRGIADHPNTREAGANNVVDCGNESC